MALVPQLSALQRNLAGTISATLALQVALLVNGVATARVLGVVDRGHAALMVLLATVLPILATCGMPLAVTYWIARRPAVGRSLMARLQSAIVMQLALVVIAHAAVLYLVFRSAAPYVQRSAALSLLGSPAIALWGYGLAILQANQRFKALNISRLVSPAIGAILLVAYLLTGIGTLFLVTATWVALYILTAVITGVAAVRTMPREPADERDSSAVPATSRVWKFGAKAMLGATTPIEAFQIDQAVVGLFVSQAQLGIYTVAAAFMNLPRFLATSIGIVAYPQLASLDDPRAQVRAIVRFAVIALILCGLAVAVIELALPLLVPLLFGDSFSPATGVARILMLGALLLALRRVLSDCARGAGRPGLGSIAELVSLGCFAVAVALLGSSAQGVAYAVVVAGAASFTTVVVGLLAKPIALRGHGVEDAPGLAGAGSAEAAPSG